MRTQSQISEELQVLMEKHSGHEATQFVVQALGWVLGEEMAASEMLAEQADEDEE